MEERGKLVIMLSNGHAYEHRAASGSLGFDCRGWPWERPLSYLGYLDVSLFTAVIKTLTLPSRRGNLRWYNPLGCIRFGANWSHNAVGLTNPGAEWWCREIGPTIDSRKRPVMGSIFGEIDELVTMAKMLNKFDLVGMEVNASCPNSQDDVLTNTERVIQSIVEVSKVSRFPILIKVSPSHDVETIIPAVLGKVEAVSINSVVWKIIYPDRLSPLAHLGGGGVSGQIAQPFTWPLVEKLAKLSDIPVCGPSVWEYEDIAKLRALGAKAIDFGSVFIPYPWRPTLFARRDSEELSKSAVC